MTYGADLTPALAVLLTAILDALRRASRTHDRGGRRGPPSDLRPRRGRGARTAGAPGTKARRRCVDAVAASRGLRAHRPRSHARGDLVIPSWCSERRRPSSTRCATSSSCARRSRRHLPRRPRAWRAPRRGRARGGQRGAGAGDHGARGHARRVRAAVAGQLAAGALSRCPQRPRTCSARAACARLLGCGCLAVARWSRMPVLVLVSVVERPDPERSGSRRQPGGRSRGRGHRRGQSRWRRGGSRSARASAARR